MKFTDKAKILAVAATVAGTAAGVAIANRLQPTALTQDYWQRAISAEKQKRISLLDEVGKFGADGSWSADDIMNVAGRLYVSHIYHFRGWGDATIVWQGAEIPGREMSPGEGIGHFMTWRYDEAFRSYDSLQERLGNLYEMLKPKEISKEKIPSAQRVADLRVLSEHRQLNSQEQEELSLVDSKPPAPLELRTTTLDQEVREAAEAMKRVLRDTEHQRKDYRLVRWEVMEAGMAYYGILGMLSLLFSGGVVAFASERRERRSLGMGIGTQTIDQQTAMRPIEPLHTNYEQLKLPF